jgi:hypothetical protein
MKRSKSFEQAIYNLTKVKSEWNKISNKMKKMYKTQYDWGEMEIRLCHIYKELNNC